MPRNKKPKSEETIKFEDEEEPEVKQISSRVKKVNRRYPKHNVGYYFVGKHRADEQEMRS